MIYFSYIIFPGMLFDDILYVPKNKSWKVIVLESYLLMLLIDV